MNPNAKLDALVRRDINIPQRHLILNLDGTPHGADDAAELDQTAITRGLDHAATISGNHWVNELLPDCSEPRNRALLVCGREPAITGYIGREDCR